MSAILFYRRVQCDVCLTQADIEAVEPSSDLLAENMPEGWTSLRGAYMTVDLRGLYGSMIGHLCPDCSALPFGKLVRRITEKDPATLKS
jgi:hypothetical protein